MTEYYTAKEVARRLKRSRRTIYEWIKNGHLRAKRVRDGYLIPRECVEEILVDVIPESAIWDDDEDD